MKKTLFIFLFLFFISNCLAYDTTDTFYLGDKVPDMYIGEYTNTNFHNGAPFMIKRSDNSLVYCINPFNYVRVGELYYGYNDNNSVFNLTQEQLNKINTIAYLGYGRFNHNDIKWYGITQFLIWETLNFTDIYFTDTYYGNKITAYVNEINELNKMVDDYYKKPSFESNGFQYSINSHEKLIDSNNVLNNYEVLESNIDYSIDDNNLYINTSKEGNYSIKFIKKSPLYTDYILYNLDGAQSLIYPGRIDDITFSINIEVISGSVTIKKEDSESTNRIDATLEGAIYGLYDDNSLITTIETNESGIGYIDKLPFGNYFIKEIKASEGYNIDEKIYRINITENNRDVVIKSYENIIKGNLIINKYYCEDGYELEDGAIFDIYNSNNSFIDSYETNNGIINAELEYGNYFIIQTKGLEGYDLVKKFNLSIKISEDYIFNLYDKKIKDIQIVNVPNTSKYDSKIYISIILIITGSLLIIKSKIKTTC